MPVYNGTAGPDTYVGTSGSDNIYGLGGNDSLSGGDGSDYIDGGDNDDTLRGGNDNDDLIGGLGNDSIDGGAGSYDSGNYSGASGGVNVNLATGLASGAAGNDTLSGVENIFASLFNDTLTGSSDNNQIWGQSGNDTISGGAGYDSLFGGTGNDSLDGGADYDTAYYHDATGAVVVNLATGLVTGAAGNDTLANIEAVRGSDFDDSMVGADNASEQLMGGAGNDTLRGGGGNDDLSGGLGNDSMDGGAGTFDYVSYWDSTAGVIANLATGLASGGAGNDTLAGFENMSGSYYGDTLTGDTGNNLFYGWEGDDSISGGGGDDELQGGNGNDTLDGGSGFDTATYYNISGAINANLATGLVSGAAGNDTLTGIENIYASDYDDTVVGDSGNNDIFGWLGDDSLAGGGGDDTIDGHDDNDTIDGGAGNDWLMGDAGADSIMGGSEDDSLEGGAGDDTLRGEAGNDRFEADAGNDSLDGSSGMDTADYAAATSAVNADLLTGFASGGGVGNDTLTGIEILYGGDFGDTLAGDQNANELHGGKGNDTLSGGLGNDLLDGGSAGFDTDTVTFAGNFGGVTANLATGVATGAGNDTLSFIENLAGSSYDDQLTGDGNANSLAGGDGADTLVGGGSADTLQGEAGDDELHGGAGNDSIVGGSGDDLVSYAFATGGVTANLVTNLASGGDGNDTLAGIEGVCGSAFNDNLTGDGGANLLIGKGGSDSLDGGTGFDTVYYGDATNGVTVNLVTHLATGLGNDTLAGVEAVMGSDFNDSITGDSAANALQGNVGSDTLVGGGGNDTLVGSGTGDGLNGSGAGDIDTAVFSGNRSEYTITYDASSGGVVVTDKVASRDGTDLLLGIEKLQFADQSATQATNTVHVDPARTYLSTSAQDGPTTPAPVMLSSLGIAPGDVITMTQLGAFQWAPNGTDTATGLMAVFSNGTSYIAPSVYQGVVSPVQAITLTSTDIPQDFMVAIGGTTRVQVPAGATMLLFSAWDGFFSDDTDPNQDFAVAIRKVDSLTGFSGNDLLFGTTGDDALDGSSGRDTVVGGAGNDVLDGGTVADRVRYIDSNLLSYSLSPAAVNINLSGIGGTGSSGRGVVLDGYGGVDRVVNFDSIAGSAFNDTILGSTANIFEKFDGGPGNDTIDGGAVDEFAKQNWNRISYTFATGAVTVDLAAGTGGGGGMGNDTLININHVFGSSYDDSLSGSDSPLAEQFYGGPGNDTLDGRGGIDEARYETAAPVNANLVTGIALDGLGGTDTLFSIEGLRGGVANDTLTGGNAASNAFEYFMGEAGNDVIDGGAGYDRVDYRTSTSAAVVTLGGTAAGTAQDGLGGTDTLLNIEAVRGSSFNDTITGSDTGAFESFEGREGNDAIDGKGGVDRADYQFNATAVAVDLSLHTAADGDGYTDTLLNIEDARGSSFNDTLTGDAGNNRLDGFEGDDSLEGLAGNDTFAGSDGFDTLTYISSTSAVSVTLAQAAQSSGTANDGMGGTDVIEHGAAEVVRGSDFNDTITGSPTHSIAGQAYGDDELHGMGGDDSIDGGSGNDFVLGEQGNDTLRGGTGDDGLMGGSGDDSLDGGTGNDTVTYFAAPSAVNVNLKTGVATGGWGNDTLVSLENLNGSLFNDTLTGGDEDNTIMGRDGNDSMAGGLGFDTATYWSATASVNVNLAAGIAQGSAGNDTLSAFEAIEGSDFNDTLTGDTNNNRLVGGAGNDSLAGGGGNDTMEGGAGNDTMDGGTGENVAVFHGNFNQYTIQGTGISGEYLVEGPDGRDIVRNVGAFRFDDRTLAVQLGTPQPDSVTIAANAGPVIFDAGGGNDVVTANDSGNALLGGGGNDQLTGGLGNDNLDGGTGNDAMAGGAGDDVYIVDSAGDTVTEIPNAPAQLIAALASLFDKPPHDINLGGGKDKIQAGLTYTLGDFLEDLTLARGAGNINGTGNGLANNIAGNEGNNTLRGLGGNDTIDGGDGRDTAFFSGNYGGYTITRTDATLVISGADGTDTLTNVERVRFDDYSKAYDINGNAGDAYRLYQAAFDRTPDIGGVGFQMNQLDIGRTLASVAGDFLASPEFQSKYGNVSDAQYIALLYQNVLHRTAAQEEIDFHVDHELHAGYSRAQVLTFFSDSPENRANVIGAIENGIIYSL